MDDESFMDMLRSGDEEDYIFSPTSCLSSSSSSFYSSAMLCFGVKQEETVAVVRGASQKSTDSSLSSLSSSPPSTIITRSQSPTKVSPFIFLDLFLTDEGPLHWSSSLSIELALQVLSSPYLQGLPSYAHLHGGGRGSDLRSRGLCLVPVSDTEHVASSNDADLWSLAVGNNRGSSDAKH
ncbi:hypothetical protein ZIOFF_072197 [Zingiber officinale]|uniref:Uncharacterized protein n=1 Tax=Zingiber officinale TaxID=94328 RepID=A0A8J5C2J3_ZINOF|nr:hypothetical protein ZIOFF_072197 [Zingiber officinale]